MSELSRARRLVLRTGLFCTDYWNADGSIRAPTEEESRQEAIAYEKWLSSYDGLAAKELDAIEAKADEEGAAIDRLERAWDNPSRGLPTPVTWRCREFAEEALAATKQHRAAKP